MFNDLHDFLKFLMENDQLKVISCEVSTELEITEISRRFLSLDGPALLFNNVIKSNREKSNFPVLTNLYASLSRIAIGLGLNVKNDIQKEFRNLGELLAFFRHPEVPTSMKGKFKLLPKLKRALAMSPKLVHFGECQEIILEEPDLSILPIQTCWPGDVGPLITWPIVITKDTKSGNNIHNLGIYRLQPIARNKLIMRWLKMRGGAEHFRKHCEQNGKCKMQVAIVIGTEPAINLAAVMPIPSNISEYAFAGLLKNKAIDLVKCKTIDLNVPANAEFVIEGEIDPEEYAEEGPFGDHTGYYNDIEKFPVVTVKKITMKKNPIYLSTYTGKFPDEPSIIGLALNEIFLPIIQKQFPEIKDFLLPAESCSYRFALVSIKKTYQGQAKRIMMGIWSFLPQFMYTKYIIVVDEDINIRDWKDVIWAISTRSDPVRDIVLIKNTPIDYLDFASTDMGLGGKMGIDATNKFGSETSRTWGKKIDMDKNVINNVDKIWENIYKM